MAVRLATVGPLSGTRSVSGGATETRPTPMPSAAATICGKMVSVPCPMSVLEV